MGRYSNLLTLSVLALLFLVFMAGGLVVQPSPVRSENASGQFDTPVAMDRLRRILADERPHPVDSEAQDGVRARLLSEIRTLGLEPTVGDAFACAPVSGGQGIGCARVRNIVFQVGPADGPAVLAAAHYDSVPAAPGAADDGLGIAVLLEVARALRDQPLQRRVIFLISDGEEPGLIGAHAFANSDPLMRSVEALVNVEARGTRGPAVFFETNQPNADAIDAFDGAPRGVANSVMADVYALLPNSTDVSVLTRDGLDVINLALLDGVEDYHTPQDNLASLDPRSVQHAGDIALHALQRLASQTDGGDQEELVYSDLASSILIHAPIGLVQAALGVSALIALVAFWLGGPTNRWRALVAPPLVLIVAASLAFGVGLLLNATRGSDYSWAHPEFARAWCVLFALTALVLAGVAARAGQYTAQVEAAALLWFTALGLLLSFFLPGASILFAPSALAFAIGVVFGRLWRPAYFIGIVLASVVALALWAPALALTELALGFAYPAGFAAIFALVGLTWLGHLSRAGVAAAARPALIALGAVSIGAIVTSGLAPLATPARPLPLNVTYFLDAENQQARILAGSAARALPEAFEGFEAEFVLPGDSAPTWAATAEVQPAPAPLLEDVTVVNNGDERLVRARLRTGGAGRVMVRIPRRAQPLRASLNGSQVEFADPVATAEFVTLICNGRSCDDAALEVVLATEGEHGADWFIVGQSPGFLVPETTALIAQRPANRTAIQNGDGALTLSTIRP